MKKKLYFSVPESNNVKQLCRKAIVEELDKCNNLTGNKFLCLLTDESALCEIRLGDIIEADLAFEVTEDFQQLVLAKLLSVNGKKLKEW